MKVKILKRLRKQIIIETIGKGSGKQSRVTDKSKSENNNFLNLSDEFFKIKRSRLILIEIEKLRVKHAK